MCVKNNVHMCVKNNMSNKHYSCFNEERLIFCAHAFLESKIESCMNCIYDSRVDDSKSLLCIVFIPSIVEKF